MVCRVSPRVAVNLHGRGPRSRVWVVQGAGPVPVPLLIRLADLHPIVLAILNTTCILQRLREEFSQIIIVRRVLEPEVPHICEVLNKLIRETLAEFLNGSRLLLLANLLVLLLVRSSFETLPWQATSKEVHKHMTQSLQVISPGLFPAKMGVNAHVPSSSRERFTLPVRNVLLGLGVTVLLCHAEIDDVDDVGGFGARPANEEIVGLDIAIDQVLLVNGLHARELKGWLDG